MLLFHWHHSLVETMEFIAKIQFLQTFIYFLCGSLCLLLFLCVKKNIIVTQRFTEKTQSGNRGFY